MDNTNSKEACSDEANLITERRSRSPEVRQLHDMLGIPLQRLATSGPIPSPPSSDDEDMDEAIGFVVSETPPTPRPNPRRPYLQFDEGEAVLPDSFEAPPSPTIEQSSEDGDNEDLDEAISFGALVPPPPPRLEPRQPFDDDDDEDEAISFAAPVPPPSPRPEPEQSFNNDPEGLDAAVQFVLPVLPGPPRPEPQQSSSDDGEDDIDEAVSFAAPVPPPLPRTELQQSVGDEDDTDEAISFAAPVPPPAPRPKRAQLHVDSDEDETATPDASGVPSSPKSRKLDDGVFKRPTWEKKEKQQQQQQAQKGKAERHGGGIQSSVQSAREAEQAVEIPEPAFALSTPAASLSTPSTTPNTTVCRKANPLLQPLAGHGITTYGPPPADNTIYLENKSSIRLRGDPNVVRGSKNGNYLRERTALVLHAKAVITQDYMCEENEVYREVVNEMQDIHASRTSWEETRTNYAILFNRPRPASVKDKKWRPPKQPAAKKLLSKSGEADLAAMWKECAEKLKRKRSESPSPGRVKKPKIKLQKRHLRYTAPASPDINCVRPDEPNNIRNNLTYRPKKEGKGDSSREEEGAARQYCARCGRLPRAPDFTALITCFVCGQRAYCSFVCQEVWKTMPCGRGCRPEKKTKVREMLPNRQRGESLGRFRDSAGLPPRERNDPQDDAVELDADEDTDMLDFSPAEIAEQRKALAMFEARKKKPVLTSDPGDRKICGHRIMEDLRTLQYMVKGSGGDATGEWVRAVDLHGPDWTKKMEEYWEGTAEAFEAREFLENPNPDHDVEPGPFGRFILKAEMEMERAFSFEIRDFERPSEKDIEDGNYWWAADDLSPKWDDALRTYWRRCAVAEKWNAAKLWVEEKGFVRRETDSWRIRLLRMCISQPERASNVAACYNDEHRKAARALLTKPASARLGPDTPSSQPRRRPHSISSSPSIASESTEMDGTSGLAMPTWLQDRGPAPRTRTARSA
ncbi:hypothetical protein BDY17DRAFT_313593 [Neohortaea acidophila]|uniref:Uncharacterized protein n=1 Tax=Neohortaea acidophila TaxID=245834 RepID=A0A6A6PGT0_9PEZI|nr:uncharacterized protein BDY17DRAFT_313593 [Neohortaea acidophila]KAF2478986.1 hypothetical protein BDY17DRAFT_313593 [Neohortaea acidophila]